jgi:hypothetical protein
MLSETRRMYDITSFEFLRTLPTPDDIKLLKSKLESHATDPTYRLSFVNDYASNPGKPYIEASITICFQDFYKTSPFINIEDALKQIKERTEVFFPGCEVTVGLKDIGVPWIEIKVIVNL